MPKAPKRRLFLPPRSRNIPLSQNPETARIRESRRSQFGLQAEEHRIKTKYRTKLARAKAELRRTKPYIQANAETKKCMEDELATSNKTERAIELETIQKQWHDFLHAADSKTSKVDEPEVMVIQVDTTDVVSKLEQEADVDDGVDATSEDWITETDSDDSDFEDGMLDAPGDEVLFDDNGQVMAPTDLLEGLESIRNRWTMELEQRLNKFIKLSKNESEVEKE
jgi:hypothetical protein